MLDPNAREITVDADGLSENTYGFYGERPLVGETLRLYNRLVERFPDVLCPPFPSLKDWGLIGYTAVNGVNYLEDTVGVSFEVVPSPQVMEYLGVTLPEGIRPNSVWTLKYGLESGRHLVKVYDLNMHRHNMPALPPRCELRVRHGIGLHLNDKRLMAFRDVYFATDMPLDELSAALGLPPPAFTFPLLDDGRALFGLLYDVRTGKPLKLKHYFYPHVLKEKFPSHYQTLQEMTHV